MRAERRTALIWMDIRWRWPGLSVKGVPAQVDTTAEGKHSSVNQYSNVCQCTIFLNLSRFAGEYKIY